jgi:hypothetical protein
MGFAMFVDRDDSGESPFWLAATWHQSILMSSSRPDCGIGMTSSSTSSSAAGLEMIVGLMLAR